MKTNTLFVIAALTLILNNIAYVWIVAEADHISGQFASDFGQVFLCVGQDVGMFAIYPTANSVFDANFTALTRADIPSANSSNFVDFYYFLRGGVPVFLGRDYYNGDNVYSMEIPVDTLPDSNCNYHIESRAFQGCIFAITVSNQFSIDKLQVEPIWDKFKNNLSTNFSTYADWSNITNATLGDPENGTLTFIGGVNYDGENLDALVNISRNGISAKVSRFYFPCADDTLIEATFYNISLLDPVVLLNDEICSGCNVTNTTNTTLTFRAILSGTVEDPWSVYSVKETGGVNLSINLNINGKDVTINWTAQPVAAYYELYWGDNVTQIAYEDPYSRPADVSPLNSLSYIDNASRNVKEKYYYIVAVKGEIKARSPETGAKFDIYNYPGRNAISIPTNTTDMTLNDMVRPSDAAVYDKIVKYQSGLGFRPTDYYGTVWQWWGTFNEFAVDAGYILFPTAERYNITVVGIVPVDNKTIPLSFGRNLIGLNSFIDYEINNITANAGASSTGDTITRYDQALGWRRTDYYGTTWKWWGHFDMLEPGRGYWFYPTQVAYDLFYDSLPPLNAT